MSQDFWVLVFCIKLVPLIPLEVPWDDLDFCRKFTEIFKYEIVSKKTSSQKSRDTVPLKSCYKNRHIIGISLISKFSNWYARLVDKEPPSKLASELIQLGFENRLGSLWWMIYHYILYACIMTKLFFISLAYENRISEIFVMTPYLMTDC